LVFSFCQDREVFKYPVRYESLFTGISQGRQLKVFKNGKVAKYFPALGDITNALCGDYMGL